MNKLEKLILKWDLEAAIYYIYANEVATNQNEFYRCMKRFWRLLDRVNKAEQLLKTEREHSGQKA